MFTSNARQLEMIDKNNWRRKAFFLVFLGLFFNVTQVFSKTVECMNEGSYKCLCKNSMRVKCDGVWRSGNVLPDTPAEFMKVRIESATGVSKVVTLQSPPGGIQDWHNKRYRPEEFANLFAQNGVRPSDYAGSRSIDIISYGLDNSTNIYDGPRDQNPMATIAQLSGEEDDQPRSHCHYEDVPELISSSSNNSSGQKLCVSKANCQKYGRVTLACPARSDGSCPTANECLSDSDISVQEPAYIGSTRENSSGETPSGRSSQGR